MAFCGSRGCRSCINAAHSVTPAHHAADALDIVREDAHIIHLAARLHIGSVDVSLLRISTFAVMSMPI